MASTKSNDDTVASQQQILISDKVQKILQDGCHSLIQQQKQDQKQQQQNHHNEQNNYSEDNSIWNLPLHAAQRSQQIRALLKSNVLTSYKNNNTTDVSLIFGKYDHDLHSHLLAPLDWDLSHEEWKLPFGSNHKRPHLVFYSPPSVTDGKSQFLIVNISACRSIVDEDTNDGVMYLYPVPLQFDLQEDDEQLMFSNKMRIARCSHLSHFHERAATDMADLCRLLCHYGKQVNATVLYQSLAFAYSKNTESGEDYLSLDPIFGDVYEYTADESSESKGLSKILYIWLNDGLWKSKNSSSRDYILNV